MMPILAKENLFFSCLHRFIQGIIFFLPVACSEGVTFHHPFLKEMLFYTLTPCVFLSALHQQTQEYHQGKPTFYRHPLWLALLLWFFWNLFVLEPFGKILSVVPLLNFVCALFLVQGFSRLFSHRDFLNSSLKALIYGSGIAAGIFVISFVWNTLDFTGQPAHGYERPFYNPNSLALFLLCPFFLSMSHFFSFPSKKTILIPLLFLGTFILAESEGAWVGLLCGVITWILLQVFLSIGLRKNILGLLVVGALLSSFILLPLFLERSTSPTVAIRYEIYQGTLSWWKNKEKSDESAPTFFQLPEAFGTLKQWTGYGAGSFRAHYGYFRSLRYALLDLSAPNTTSPHNFQWEILVESGIIGLGFFYVILWFFFTYGHTILTQQTPFRSLTCSCLAGMVAILVDGLTSHFFFSEMNWFVLSFFIGVVSNLYFSSKVFPSPYPHYLLGVPSKKQKQLDHYFFFFLTIWSALFLWEFVYKAIRAEIWLKQAGLKEGKSLEFREELLLKVLNFSYETETRRMARFYLIDIYQDLALKYNLLNYWKKAYDLAIFQDKIYPKSGNTLLAISNCQWQLQTRSNSPPEMHWLRSMKDYILAFPFYPEVGAGLRYFLPSLKTHELLLLRDLGISSALEQRYKEAEKASDLAVREKDYAKKMSTLSYHLYLLNPSSSEWIEHALHWNPRHRGFKMLLARFWFQQKQISKAQTLLNSLTPSELESQSRQFTQQKDQEFQKFLKQHWSTMLPHSR
ncbi:MAG: O-antigen ligase family protein [Planctomycetota bacterium]